ncbi:hypothetical protein [Actinoplanes sp. NPDC026623]|uniref:VOC family protein n=1 Tax=Actinoplanes sp. NPDC026623 TaxID=3155610 RepID=UPI0033F5DA8C
MSGEVLPRGLTLQIPVGDIEAGRRFYTALFGRGPDFAPHHDFLEWRVLAGVELWWQVVGMTEAFQPLATRVRLLVDDVRVAARHVETALGVPASAVTTLPSVVKFINFEDPWATGSATTRTSSRATSSPSRAAASTTSGCTRPTAKTTWPTGPLAVVAFRRRDPGDAAHGQPIPTASLQTGRAESL